jgi:hypothetical protein
VQPSAIYESTISSCPVSLRRRKNGGNSNWDRVIADTYRECLGLNFCHKRSRATSFAPIHVATYAQLLHSVPCIVVPLLQHPSTTIFRAVHGQIPGLPHFPSSFSMDIPHHIGEKLYPFSHIIGYRPANFNSDRTRFMPGFRDKAWVKKAENCMLTFLGAWGALTFIGELSKHHDPILTADLLIALAARAHEFQARHVPTIIGSFGAGEGTNGSGRWPLAGLTFLLQYRGGTSLRRACMYRAAKAGVGMLTVSSRFPEFANGMRLSLGRRTRH